MIFFTFTNLILVGEYDAIQVIARYASLYFDEALSLVLITASSLYSRDSWDTWDDQPIISVHLHLNKQLHAQPCVDYS